MSPHLSIVIDKAATALCAELSGIVRGEEVLSFDETYARIEYAQNHCLRQLAATDLWGRDNQIPSGEFWKKAGKSAPRPDFLFDVHDYTTK